jgi:beta-mannosidase
MEKGKHWLKIPVLLEICLLICIISVAFSCHRAVPGTNENIPLHSSWQFRKSGAKIWLPANVPGSVAADIWRNKTEGKNLQIRTANNENWEYRTIFDVQKEILEHDVIQLCFDGLDTYAMVYLNDSLILNANSRFRQWQVDCKHLLRPRGNQLKVYLQSPVRYKMNPSSGTGKKYYISQINHATEIGLSPEYKSNCQVSEMGIFRPVYLKVWSVANVDDIYLQPVSVTPQRAGYIAQLSVSSVKNITLKAELLLNNKQVLQSVYLPLQKGKNSFRLGFFIDKPKLWWPNGMGNQNLYDVRFRLQNSQGTIHEIHQRLGVRSIEVVTPSVSSGQGFYFKLNGIPLFVKGAGYAPSTNYPSGKNYARLIESASLANFNILRLYSCGIYENDIFYDLCDENGILVWQDFIVRPNMAITDTSPGDFKQEAIENVKRLRQHPCIALWWGDDLALADNTRPAPARVVPPDIPDKKKKLFQDVFPNVVKEYASPGIYLTASGCQTNKSQQGIDVFNGQLTGSLVTGYGVPSFGGTRYPLPADSLLFPGIMEDMYNDIKSALQNKDLSEYMAREYNPPKEFESEVYLTRLAQAEIMKAVIENHRLHMPVCMGSIYTEMNDSRPGISPSTICLSGWWKPAHYTIKSAFSHISVIPSRENNMVNIYVSSDALKDMDAILLARLINFSGDDLYVKQVPVRIIKNASSLLLAIKETELLRNADKSKCCLVVQLNQANKTISQNILYFTEPKNLSLPKSVIELDVNETMKGYNVVLKSPVFAKNVFIETVSGTGWFSDNNIDLLPEKRTKVSIRYPGTKDELLRDIRIRSLADIK